ncbi:MAG TPA: histidine phosphatase family protein [Candidatus Woesearchaeota archaeon]|nr:histidine phosphatase family protein [Candidatus Woesearchaeota archaeon]
MKVILVRHGQTEENVRGISQGHIPGTLSDLGLLQAKKVAEYLKDYDIDAVYVSDLKRVVDTTKEIMKFHSETPVVYTKELRELGKGSLDGKPREVCREYVKDSGKPFYECEWETGDSLLKTQKRIRSFFDSLLIKHKDETVLLVGHGGALGGLLMSLIGGTFEDYDSYRMDNASVTVFEINSEGKTNIVCRNCVDHLE